MPIIAVGTDAPPDEVSLLLSLVEEESSSLLPVDSLSDPLVVLVTVGVLRVVASVELAVLFTMTVGAPETEDWIAVTLPVSATGTR